MSDEDGAIKEPEIDLEDGEIEESGGELSEAEGETKEPELDHKPKSLASGLCGLERLPSGDGAIACDKSNSFYRICAR